MKQIIGGYCGEQRGTHILSIRFPKSQWAEIEKAFNAYDISQAEAVRQFVQLGINTKRDFDEAARKIFRGGK